MPDKTKWRWYERLQDPMGGVLRFMAYVATFLTAISIMSLLMGLACILDGSLGDALVFWTSGLVMLVIAGASSFIFGSLAQRRVIPIMLYPLPPARFVWSGVFKLEMRLLRRILAKEESRLADALRGLSDREQAGQDPIIKRETLGGTVGLEHLNPSLRAMIEGNPYLVLGIAADSRESHALDACDRIAKLEKLGAAGSYTSPLDLPWLKLPDRTLSRASAVCANLGKAEHRLRYFAHGGRYDEFLHEYYRALVCDPGFNEASLWERTIGEIAAFSAMGDDELALLVSDHLPHSEGEMPCQGVSPAVLEEVLLSPIRALVPGADRDTLGNLLALCDRHRDIADPAREPWSQLAHVATEEVIAYARSTFEPLSAIWEAGRADGDEERPLFIAAVRTWMYLNFERCSQETDRMTARVPEFARDVAMVNLREMLLRVSWMLRSRGPDYIAKQCVLWVYPYLSPLHQSDVRKRFLELKNELPGKDYTASECLETARQYVSCAPSEVAVDWASVRDWALQAVEKGDMSAAGLLGKALIRSKQGNKRYAGHNAREWLEIAASNGDADAIAELKRTHPLAYARKAKATARSTQEKGGSD